VCVTAASVKRTQRWVLGLLLRARLVLLHGARLANGSWPALVPCPSMAPVSLHISRVMVKPLLQQAVRRLEAAVHAAATAVPAPSHHPGHGAAAALLASVTARHTALAKVVAALPAATDSRIPIATLFDLSHGGARSVLCSTRGGRVQVASVHFTGPGGCWAVTRGRVVAARAPVTYVAKWPQTTCLGNACHSSYGTAFLREPPSRAKQFGTKR